jgi:hypothetical protein
MSASCSSSFLVPSGPQNLMPLFEHLARLARVAHDQDLRGVGRGYGRRGAAQVQREVGGQELARDPADAVGAE